MTRSEMKKLLNEDNCIYENALRVLKERLESNEISIADFLSGVEFLEDEARYLLKNLNKEVAEAIKKEEQE